MTAISVAAPSSLQAVIPLQPESKQAAQSQLSFKKVLKDLPESDQSDEAQTTGKKKTSEQDDASLPIPFVSAPAKLLLPVSFPRQEFRASNLNNSQDPMDAEVLNIPKATNDSTASDGELAFAAKLVDTATPQTSPAAARSAAPSQPLPKVSKEPVPAEPQTDRRPAPAQNQNQPDAPQTHEQGTMTAVAPPSRDALSSPPPRSTEPVQQTHAIDHVAPEPALKPASTPVNEISVRVDGPDQTSASIRLVDHSGEIRVAVRSPDTQLAEALRSNVDQLSTRLNTNGWNADVWRPGTVPSTARSEASGQDTPRDRQESAAQQFRDTTRRDSQNNQQKRPDWVEKFYDRNE